MAGTNAAAALLWTSVALARWPRVSAASSREIQQTLDGLRQQALRDGLTEQQAQLAEQRQEADGLLLELAAEGEALSDEFLANAQQEAALRQEILDAQAAYEAALSAEEAARGWPSRTRTTWQAAAARRSRREPPALLRRWTGPM